MKMLLLDEAFCFLYARLLWRSSKPFGCAVAPFHVSQQLQHLADSMRTVNSLPCSEMLDSPGLVNWPRDLC